MPLPVQYSLRRIGLLPSHFSDFPPALPVPEATVPGITFTLEGHPLQALRPTPSRRPPGGKSTVGELPPLHGSSPAQEVAQAENLSRHIISCRSSLTPCPAKASEFSSSWATRRLVPNGVRGDHSYASPRRRGANHDGPFSSGVPIGVR